jgi:hypothetical protein
MERANGFAGITLKKPFAFPIYACFLLHLGAQTVHKWKILEKAAAISLVFSILWSVRMVLQSLP